MFVINIIITIIFISFLIVRYDPVNLLEQTRHPFLPVLLMNYVILPSIDAFFVYKWSREWNQRISKTLIS